MEPASPSPRPSGSSASQSSQDRGNGSRPALTRTNPNGPPEPADAAFVATRVSALAHELSNILDGSMRTLGLAKRALADRGLQPPATPETPEGGAISKADEVSRRIDVVQRAMEHMADLIRHTMSGLDGSACIGSRRGLADAWSVNDALEHATEVLRPVAEEHGISIEMMLDGRLDQAKAGQLYAAISAAIRNAIESIRFVGRERAEAARVGRAWRGLIRIEARLGHPQPGCTYKVVEIDVIDNGLGPPPLPKGAELLPFKYGFSTKTTGTGIGLALAKEIVDDLAGTIELRPRGAGDGPADPENALSGAVLSIRFPLTPSMKRETP